MQLFILIWSVENSATLFHGKHIKYDNTIFRRRLGIQWCQFFATILAPMYSKCQVWEALCFALGVNFFWSLTSISISLSNIKPFYYFLSKTQSTQENANYNKNVQSSRKRELQLTPPTQFSSSVVSTQRSQVAKKNKHKSHPLNNDQGSISKFLQKPRDVIQKAITTTEESDN